MSQSIYSRWPYKGNLTRIWQELQPTPGRYQHALRLAGSVTLATLIMDALKMPLLMAPGLYMMFLYTQDQGRLTWRNGAIDVGSVAIADFLMIFLQKLTRNDPVFRVIYTFVLSFIAGLMLIAFCRKTCGILFGVFTLCPLHLWDYRLFRGTRWSTEAMTKYTMWSAGIGVVAVVCKTVFDYVFIRYDPREKLEREMDGRVGALERLFRGFADGAPDADIAKLGAPVAGYALSLSGLYNYTDTPRSMSGKMLDLVEEAQRHPLAEITIYNLPPTLFPSVARLLDLGAAFSRQKSQELSDEQKAQCKRLADALSALRAGRGDELRSFVLEGQAEESAGLLDQAEHVLYNISVADLGGPAAMEGLKAILKEQRLPWFGFWVPGTWNDLDKLTHAFRFALGTTLGYIFFLATSFFLNKGGPGTYTIPLSVMVGGSAISTGGITQKMIQRMIAVSVGGALFGYFALVYIFPNDDHRGLGMLVSTGIVCFISGWVMCSRVFGYIGVQIAFAYTIVTNSPGLKPPRGLWSARDRFIGQCIALFILWICYYAPGYYRTIDRMRQQFGKMLMLNANMLSSVRVGSAAKVPALRAAANGCVESIRPLDIQIAFEFDQQVEEDLALSKLLQKGVQDASSLFMLSASALPSGKESLVQDGTVLNACAALEDRLRKLAGVLVQKRVDTAGAQRLLASFQPLEIPESCPEFLSRAFAVYKDIEKNCWNIIGEPDQALGFAQAATAQ
ncbi:MAG: hypothetical protein CXZ00_08370 [Acidobacteria bacterium]|nr:MAG: hypothetical protein CXZ00_08370 [Acidobacteriota bacterium]